MNFRKIHKSAPFICLATSVIWKRYCPLRLVGFSGERKYERLHWPSLWQALRYHLPRIQKSNKFCMKQILKKNEIFVCKITQASLDLVYLFSRIKIRLRVYISPWQKQIIVTFCNGMAQFQAKLLGIVGSEFVQIGALSSRKNARNYLMKYSQ